MSVRRTLEKHHEVLNEDPFCSGYMDSFGKWNNGFDCPSFDSESVHCCGTFSYRYCCSAVKSTTDTDPSTSEFISERWPLLLGVVIGTLCTTAILAAIVACICRSRSCCTRQITHQKQTNSSSECYYAAPSTISGATSLYGTSSSLSRSGPQRGDANHHFHEQMQEIEESSVYYPEPSASAGSFNNLSCSKFPRTLNNFSCVKPVMSEDFLEKASMSTSSDNERQIFAEQCPLPPPMNTLQSQGRMVPRTLQRSRLSSTIHLPESLTEHHEDHFLKVNSGSMLLSSYLPAPPSFCSQEKLKSECSPLQVPDQFSLATKL